MARIEWKKEGVACGIRVRAQGYVSVRARAAGGKNARLWIIKGSTVCGLRDSLSRRERNLLRRLGVRVGKNGGRGGSRGYIKIWI